MDFEVQCPFCGNKQKIGEEDLGTVVKCAHCYHQLECQPLIQIQDEDKAGNAENGPPDNKQELRRRMMPRLAATIGAKRAAVVRLKRAAVVRLKRAAIRRLILPLVMLGSGIVLGVVVTYFAMRPTEPPDSPKPTDPNAKYREVQLREGMTIEELKEQFGEPDESPEEKWSQIVLKYGPFGAHDQRRGHVTKHRLTLEFHRDKLVRWEKSVPRKE